MHGSVMLARMLIQLAPMQGFLLAVATAARPPLTQPIIGPWNARGGEDSMPDCAPYSEPIPPTSLLDDALHVSFGQKRKMIVNRH